MSSLRRLTEAIFSSSRPGRPKSDERKPGINLQIHASLFEKIIPIVRRYRGTAKRLSP
ncbi:hypothetical protein AGR1B_Lc10446 [Agrobacterium fabacearum S56]|nr:hypothetical protein AGR1B_Lc10446 [Agrobacterium fabacearum S56]